MTDTLKMLNALLIGPNATVRDTMVAINQGVKQIALVVDSDNKLLATVTDGDVRRGLLRGVTLDAPASDVMFTAFTSATVAQGRDIAVARMRDLGLHHLPILDDEGTLVDLLTKDDLPNVRRRTTRVVLMAGGLGTRLRPLTETVPKPMLEVNGTPILELILRNFTAQGFHDFTISLNYKGHMIRDHFGDGRKFNARIDYVQETKRLGTAGALSLLPTRPTGPFIVMNADLLTAIPFDAVLQFHEENGALGTMCARNYAMQVPYGVIEVNGAKLTGLVEKPTYSHFVNAGIYVLSPEVLDHVAADEFFDMPTLFERIMKHNDRACVFPIQEYWMDIGRMEDLDQARKEYGDIFGDATDDRATS